MKSKSISLEKEKLDLIKWITSLQDETSIERLKMLKDNPKHDWWDEISIEEKKSIEKGLSDIKAGRVKTHKEARKIYEKWL